jgi:hypothetical protein
MTQPFENKDDRRTRYERGSELARECFEIARDPRIEQEGLSKLFESFGEMAGQLANKHRQPGAGIATKHERAKLRAHLGELSRLLDESEEVKDHAGN